ncbi:MAG: C4-type zinc ribbon domain-containing protein [Treponema sp.]|nr:C4-type zinc ribbon domain-containing protein [Treponema sp.]
MVEVFENLKTLQGILSEKIELEQKIQEIPKLLVTQEELLARMKKSFFEKSQEHEKTKAVEVELRNSLAIAEAEIEKAEKNMELINTQREYETVDKERETAEIKAKDFRAKLLKEERALLDLDEQIKQNQALIEQQEKELEERRRGIEEEVSEKKTQMAELLAREKDLSPDLDPEVLFKFERIIRNKMGRGIVAIKGGVCMGCHMILPAQFANTVHQGEEIIFCPYCSRILFFEESEQGEEDFFNNEDSGSLSDLDDIEEDYDDDEEEEEEEKPNVDYEE